MNITAPLSRIKNPLIRKPLWVMWFPILIVNLTVEHWRSKNYQKIVLVCWRMGWHGIAP